ncbi:MAG: hydroxymethylglutaryl-CoA lyase [Bacteroidetes bacterium]|nr:hydroxymethylglutaryl-CoA lyase [Bacteroidota bacterium]
MIKIIESPREGLQGFSHIIPTGEKVRYINHLLRVGFDTVEIGSIVSPRIIPQMADSLGMLKKLDLQGITTNRMFLAINARGAEMLAEMDEITHISYPFSFSPSFLKLNVNSTVEKSLLTTEIVTSLCRNSGKQAVIYISMAFGNPYGDPWSIELLTEWVSNLHQAGARIIPLSNVSMEIDETLIAEVFSTLIPMFPDTEFGLHLHTANQGWYDKVNAAYLSGCRRFDGVIMGLGGCPMAGKELLGNLNTLNLIEFEAKKTLTSNINPIEWSETLKVAEEVFSIHAC